MKGLFLILCFIMGFLQNNFFWSPSSGPRNSLEPSNYPTGPDGGSATLCFLCINAQGGSLSFLPRGNATQWYIMSCMRAPLSVEAAQAPRRSRSSKLPQSRESLALKLGSHPVVEMTLLPGRPLLREAVSDDKPSPSPLRLSSRHMHTHTSTHVCMHEHRHACMRAHMRTHNQN